MTTSSCTEPAVRRRVPVMTPTDPAATRPSPGLSPDETAARFDALQARLAPLWTSLASLNQDEQTIVVVPSMTLSGLDVPATVMQAYEERYLFLLLLLRQPNARMIYVTSRPILENVIDYYLGLLPGVIHGHARARLFNPAPHDGSPRPLVHKLLERPRLLRRIRALIPDRTRAHLVPFVTTESERDLALRLDIPMYGADPRHFVHGTKSGCRKLFGQAAVPYPLGAEDLTDLGGVVDGIRAIRASHPDVRYAMVKHNEGVSGGGNAVVDLRDLAAPGSPDEPAAIDARVRVMRFEDPAATFDTYMATLAELGGIVEERIVGDEVRSPSVQLRITPLGRLEILSTHDQILGGPSGQSYLGCRFPADAGYATLITREAAKVGEALVATGVIGRFAIDFVVVRRGATWAPYAIELNLRKGGTTHPFLTLQFLTDGTYDHERGVFTTPNGHAKCFVATDHLESPAYRTLTPDDLFDAVVRHRLHFNQSSQTGVVFHMLTSLSEQGRVGLTAVGDSHAEADTIYARAVAMIDAEAAAAGRQEPL